MYWYIPSIGNAHTRSTEAIARPSDYTTEKGFTIARALREGATVHGLTSLLPRSTSTLHEWRQAESEFAVLWCVARAARLYELAHRRATTEPDFRGALIERFQEAHRALAETDSEAAKLWGRGEDLVETLDSARADLDAILYAPPEEREEAWETFLAEGEDDPAAILYPAWHPTDSPLAALTSAEAWVRTIGRSREGVNRGL